MIISHKNKYIFIQLPHTASTSIGRELVKHYDGERILYKHSRYTDFLKIASQQEKKYFAFSCIRNPLEIVITKYLKYKNIAGGGENYTNPKTWKCNGGWVSNYELKIFRFIQNNQASFSDFFLHFYPLTYDNWSSISHQSLDFIIRYETLDADFTQVLQHLKLERKRKLPIIFSTPGKEALDQYYTPDIQPHATAILGPFMRRWNYTLPVSWEHTVIPWYRELEYNLLSIPRCWYWSHIQKHQGSQQPRCLDRKPPRSTPWSRAQP